MKKYLLPLILILFLTFTFIGDCWVSGYDQRIKLTTDHTKVDATLTWFPVTVLLTSTAGEEVFAEFDADEDFDRVAFTKSDGTTQLYADCEKFDDSAQVAIYHVSRDGWEISSSADTDFYMYYDNDAAHNTTYIGKSGGTAAQSVYDANFKAVYHMHDTSDGDISYDTKYEATVEPDSDGWASDYDDFASVSAGILTIDTSANDNNQCRYSKTPDIDFSAGFYMRTRVKASTDMNPGDDVIYFEMYDGTANKSFILGIRNGSIVYTDHTGSLNSVAFDTTTDYVVYEIYVKGSTHWVYADGVQKISALVFSQSVSDFVRFGDSTTNKICKAEIDYVYYALDVTDNPLLTVYDSTSNNNDGTKASSGNPVEVTGKVGQAQDFSSDHISMDDSDDWYFDGDFTLEIIVNFDTCVNGNRYNLITQYESSSKWWAVRREADDKLKVVFYDTTSDGDYVTTDVFRPSTGTWYHIAFVKDGVSTYIYVNGVSWGVTEQIAWDTLINYVADLWMGAWEGTPYYIDGKLDEVHISKGIARSAAWVKGNYNSLWDSFLTYGSEETEAVGINVIFFGTNF